MELINIAWHIPQELMNNNPLPESHVRDRFDRAGYKIIDYTYKNNTTRMLCYDRDGFIVKVSLDSLRTNTKEYVRFSPTYNIDGFMFNLNHYRELNPELPKVIDWKYKEHGKEHKQQVWLLCECKECGEQFWTHLTNWKNGSKIRCNYCVRTESNLEILVRKWLEENNINFIQEYKFDDCVAKRRLPFDFYLPQHNICIEVDGIQHYKSGERLHGHLFDEQDFKKIVEHDEIKNNYCKENNIKLLRLGYDLFKKDKEYIKILKNNLLITGEK